MKLTRRDFSKFAGAGVLAAAAPSVFSPAIAQDKPLRIGIIAPRSGAAGTCARTAGISGSTRLRPGATHLMSSKLPSKCSITAVQLSIQSPQLM